MISALEVIKPFSISTKHKFIMLINVKMPTIVGILALISKINTTHEMLKANTSSFIVFLVFKSS